MLRLRAYEAEEPAKTSTHFYAGEEAPCSSPEQGGNRKAAAQSILPQIPLALGRNPKGRWASCSSRCAVELEGQSGSGQHHVPATPSSPCSEVAAMLWAEGDAYYAFPRPRRHLNDRFIPEFIGHCIEICIQLAQCRRSLIYPFSCAQGPGTQLALQAIDVDPDVLHRCVGRDIAGRHLAGDARLIY